MFYKQKIDLCSVKKKCLTFNIILKLKIIVPKEKLLAVNGTKFWGSSIRFHFAVSLSTVPLTKNKKWNLRLKLCETDSKVSTPVSRRDNNGWEEKSSLTSIQNFPGSYLIDYFYDFFHLFTFKYQVSDKWSLILKQTCSWKLRVCEFVAVETRH